MEINNLVTVLHQKTAHKFMLMFETLEQQILQQEREDEECNYCSNVDVICTYSNHRLVSLTSVTQGQKVDVAKLATFVPH